MTKARFKLKKIFYILGKKKVGIYKKRGGNKKGREIERFGINKEREEENGEDFFFCIFFFFFFAQAETQDKLIFFFFF
jgi:hypothetical protein